MERMGMERRQHLRQGVRRPGRIMLGGRGDLPCYIRDITSGGARLDVPDARVVGYALDLRDVMSGAIRKCSVIWRDGYAVGVQFIGSGSWPKLGQQGASGSFGRRSRLG
jgi:hypothetical protein